MRCAPTASAPSIRGDRYYLVTLPEGAKFLFPTTVGHYPLNAGPGVNIQLQVAP